MDHSQQSSELILVGEPADDEREEHSDEEYYFLEVTVLVYFQQRQLGLCDVPFVSLQVLH